METNDRLYTYESAMHNAASNILELMLSDLSWTKEYERQTGKSAFQKEGE